VKISLIELTTFDTSAIGVRRLPAGLKRAGYQVQLIFLANAGSQNESQASEFARIPQRTGILRLGSA
jgi:hypothetical protein